MFLSQLLLPESWRDDKDFRANQEKAHDMVLSLYRRVLEFEMNCVCATATSWNMAAKNVVDWQGLVNMDRGIRQENEELGNFIQEHCTESVATRLLALDRDLEVSLPSSTDAPQTLTDGGAPGAPSTGASSAGAASTGLTQIKA
jgi:hypothetical protein